MKKSFIAAVATALFLSVAPALSGCGGDDVKFVLSEEGEKHYTVSLSPLSSLTGEYEIPAYFGEGDAYAPVTEIADEGFAGSRLTKITVPATVTKIGTAAFGYCNYLETVEFADGIKLDKLSHGMFGKCEKLGEITIPDSVTEIDGLAFSGCSRLFSVTMNSVEVIGNRAFYGCTAMENITLPSTLETIGNMAFYNSGLKEIEIPASVRDKTVTDSEGKESTVYGLGYAAFNNCLNLERVKINDGIKVIPSAAFGYCVGLKEIHIPLSVEEVQGATYDNLNLLYGHAFYGDTALTDVYYAGDEAQWKNIKIETKTAYENGISMNNKALTDAEKHYNGR